MVTLATIHPGPLIATAMGLYLLFGTEHLVRMLRPTEAGPDRAKWRKRATKALGGLGLMIGLVGLLIAPPGSSSDGSNETDFDTALAALGAILMIAAAAGVLKREELAAILSTPIGRVTPLALRITDALAFFGCCIVFFVGASMVVIAAG